MKKLCLATFVSIGLITTSASAVTYTIGDIVSGIAKVVSSTTAGSSSDNSSATSSAPSGVLVKDLPDLPKLTDKPFARGIVKIDYSEIPTKSKKNNDLLNSYWKAFQVVSSVIRSVDSKNSGVLAKDSKTLNVLERVNPVSTFSNPYGTFKGLFDISKLGEITRTSETSIYSYKLKTHIKIPDEFVKNGKIVFETPEKGPIFYRNKDNHKDGYMDFMQVCYQFINGDYLNDVKGVYSVKKGNLIDYSMTCYFAGQNSLGKNEETIQSIYHPQDSLPVEFKIYAVPDPLAKDAGKSYTITNRDMFLYENEVYPAK